mgnify:CR=1 FL=1
MEQLTGRTTQILVVDDDIFVREMISDILESLGFTIYQAEHGKEALSYLEQNNMINLIVSDLNMPEMNGLELVDAVRQFNGDIPIIILTVNSEIETAIQAIQKGADDYILKGSAIAETLPLSVAKVLEIFDLKMQNRELIQDLSRKNAELEQLAFLDGLTGIPNRRFYDLTLTSMWHTAKRNGTSISMIMTDIDRFKQLNDTLGHHYGDLCIQAVAKTFNRTLTTKNAVIARFGGDEFVAVLPETTAEEAAAVAEQMRENIMKLRIKDPETGAIKEFTMSFGVFGVIPANDSIAESLFESADKALYTSKESGRNRVSIQE